MAKARRNTQYGGYKIAGRSKDGVAILEPVTKPTHFTSREVRSSIANIRREATSGRFLTRGAAKTTRDAKLK